MKLKNIKSMIPAAGVLAMLCCSTACVNDLDVTPIDPSVTQTFDEFGVFVKCYGTLGLSGQIGAAGDGDVDGLDEGTCAFIRQLFNVNELPTDEAMCCWNDDGIPDYNFNSWTSNHGMVRGMYSKLLINVTICNQYLDLASSEGDNAMHYAEVRFLRALNYYYLMDIFGNPPFATSVSTSNPHQMDTDFATGRAKLCDWIESELLDLVGQMAEPGTNDYYRVDKAAAWMLLSRIYLNHEVYTGTARWADAAEYSKKIIDCGKYKLASKYRYLFMGDNGKYDGTANDAYNEIILPIAADGIQTRGYGNTTFLIQSTHTSGMDNWNLTGGWGGNRSRKALIEKFYGSTLPDTCAEADMIAAAGDDRAMFHSKGRTYDISSKSAPFTEGVSVTKFSNVRTDGAAGHDGEFADTDFALMRLGEAYLNYAEALLRNGGSAADATAAVNVLRKRANAPEVSNVSLDGILDERSRELYFETLRRTDLIRFGYFGGNNSYMWDWKGGTQNGSSFDAKYNVYAIPSADMGANPNLVQNPGF